MTRLKYLLSSIAITTLTTIICFGGIGFFIGIDKASLETTPLWIYSATLFSITCLSHLFGTIILSKKDFKTQEFRI